MRPELFTVPFTKLVVPSFGAMVMIGFLGGLFWMTRRARKAKQDPDLVLNLGFIALLFMVVGARTFYVIHYWDSQFKHQPAQIINLSSGGFEFYGGFIGAFVPCLLYGLYKRMSVRLWTDITIPSLLFGMGVGRIGCFLAGCCYGASCPAGLPWAVRFPFASEPFRAAWEARQIALPAPLVQVSGEGITTLVSERMAREIAGMMAQGRKAMEQSQAKGDAARLERQRYALARLGEFDEHLADFGLTPARLSELADDPRYRSGPLHPAQLYSAIGPLLLAWLTNAVFYRRKRQGVVFVLGLSLYAVERFIEESLRTDNPVDTFGLTVSQAISVGLLAVMGVWYLVLRRLPLRSPRAVAFVPPPDRKKEEAAQPAAA
ncbi:MAG: hypothetical protein AMXMBFR83_06550 [Phycisphaerae bacterium]